MGKLLTSRHDFGVTTYKDTIFIIGGVNYKEVENILIIIKVFTFLLKGFNDKM